MLPAVRQPDAGAVQKSRVFFDAAMRIGKLLDSEALLDAGTLIFHLVFGL